MKHLAISDSKERTTLTIDKDFKAILAEKAKYQGISFNALVMQALEEYDRRGNKLEFGDIRDLIDKDKNININVISSEDRNDLVGFSFKKSIDEVYESYNRHLVNKISVENERVVVYLEE